MIDVKFPADLRDVLKRLAYDYFGTWGHFADLVRVGKRHEYGLAGELTELQEFAYWRQREHEWNLWEQRITNYLAKQEERELIRLSRSIWGDGR